MANGRSPRDGHTALGWWIMTHARGGAAIIGCVALVVLIADAAYVATHWQRAATSLHFGFVGGVALLALVWASGFFLGLSDPTGEGREKARARTRHQQKFLGPVSLLGYVVAFAFGMTVVEGVILGEFALLACFFLIICSREVVKPQHEWQPRSTSTKQG